MGTRPPSASSDPPDGEAPRGATPRLKFSHSSRIVDSPRFDEILQRGARLNDARLTVWAARNGRSQPRLGLIVGRRSGGAVVRARWRRLVREAFRLSQHELPRGLDLICGPRGARPPALRDVLQSLRALAGRLDRMLPPEEVARRTAAGPASENPRANPDRNPGL